MADLHLHRILKAPRSAVWRCWTDAAHIPHWFAPKPVVVTVLGLDARPGGILHIAMTMDGKDLGGVPGCFLEVIREERLTWTSALGPDFRPIGDDRAAFLFTATITLADHPDGTDYRVVARHKDDAAAAQHESMGFSDGWGTVADQLGAYAATLAPVAKGSALDGSERTMTLERTFRASPAQVYAAWTDPDALPRWFGPKGYACTTTAMDVRVGGQWRFDMIGDGMTFPNRHRWTELSPGRCVAFLMDDGDDARAPYEVVVTLTPEGAGTRLVQVVTFPTASDLERAKGYDAVGKGYQTLTKLAEHLGE